MQIPSNQFSKLTIAWLAVSALLLLFPSQMRPQSAFDQAHDLVKGWSTAQQAQQQNPSEANFKNLREATSSVAREVPELLKTGTLELLNSSGIVSSSKIVERISSALFEVPSAKYDPEVFVFPIGSRQGASYFVGFNVPYCASCSRAWIGLIGKKNGRYDVLSEEGKSFDGKSLQVSPLGRNENGNDRFLIYGTNWGDAHSRLSVVAYVVDEAKLRRIWARIDLPQGSIKVTPTEIIVSSLTALVPPWREKTEVYRILPEQIKLEQSIERPNP